MKRSKKIQLVIITAALASCGRYIIPMQSSSNINVDSTLTALPADSESVSCNCWHQDSSIKNHTINSPGINNFIELADNYFPGHLYRKEAFWRNDHFIVRGGFGKSIDSSVS
jgi:hypothetical protein